MCAIIGWAGKLPQGFMTHILREAETRGRDSVGVAYRQDNLTLSDKQAVSASRFIKEQEKILGAARRSLYGLAHTRRASPGMPINDENAHPFVYGGFVFAHNGRVENFRDLRAVLQAKYEGEAAAGLDAKSKEKAGVRADFFKLAQTDSKVLGEFIELRDFSEVEGSLGLTWMKSGKLYAFHSAKELTGFHVTWWVESPRTPDEEGLHSFTIIASTAKMILQALGNTRGEKRKKDGSYAGICYDYQDMLNLEEGTVYRLEIPAYPPGAMHILENLLPGTGLVNEGRIPVNGANHPDDFTSAEDAPTAPARPPTAVAVSTPPTTPLPPDAPVPQVPSSVTIPPA